MADEKQVEKLRSDVEAWNEWRRSHVGIIGAHPDLRGADLSNCDLRGADLTIAELTGADFNHSDLRGANLSRAHLTEADLSHTDLSRADFTSAELTGADLSSAALGGADLSHANLMFTDLSGADLTIADLSDAWFGFSSLAGLDLSATSGLSRARHYRPSSVSTSTLEATAAGLTMDGSRRGEVEAFFRGAGVPEDLLTGWFALRIGQPIQFYSAFISYSHSDKAFAGRLHADLQAAGIRCWLDDKDVRGGDVILDVVNSAIRSHDKLILCCSLASLSSSWVGDEIAAAFERERNSDERILIPLDLDGYLFDGYEGRFGPRIRERYAIPFDGWSTEAAVYEAGLEATQDALRPREREQGS